MQDPKLRELLQGCAGSGKGGVRYGQEDHMSPVPRVGLVGDRGISWKIALGIYPYELEDQSEA